MATYKVIQDIEAEDKLLGPLTLRQFSYAGITVFCLWLGYFVVLHGAAFLVVIIAPFAFVSAFFAFPWSREQPTEIWALARIRFILKPRKRIWDQSGLRELVTITVPKRIEHIYSDGLSQTEVRSRLHALAETIDSRGWAIKNTAMNPYISPAMASVTANGDRLIDPSSVPQDVPINGSDSYQDVFDSSNPKMQQFDSMLNASAQAHRAQLVQTMQQPAVATPQQNTPGQPADYWFLNQPSKQSVPKGNDVFGNDVVTPGSITDNHQASGLDEDAITKQLAAKATDSSSSRSHLPTILPLAEQEKLRVEAQKAAADTFSAPINNPLTVTAPADAAILGLAHNDDLNIATIARQAKREQASDESEVVISLH
jgi:hypothetical protein